MVNTDMGSRLSRSPRDTVLRIRDPDCRDEIEDVLGAMMGPPPNPDPNHVELRVAVLPKVSWPLKEANAHLSKILALIPEQWE